MLIGTTRFEPRPDVKNIMITGGAGFMYAPLGYHSAVCRVADRVLEHAGSSGTSPSPTRTPTTSSRSTSWTTAPRSTTRAS